MVWSQWRQNLAGGAIGGVLGLTAFLAGAHPALAIDPIPFDLTDVTFTTEDETTGRIDGSFLLPCDFDADSLDCVQYNGDQNTIEQGWTLSGDGDYVFKTLLPTSPTQIGFEYPVPTTGLTFTSAIYGYNFDFNNGTDVDGRYFLFLLYDVQPNSQDFAVLLYLDGTGGAQGTSRLPEIGRDFNGFYVPASPNDPGSGVCDNPKPPPASGLCPGGQFVAITEFGGNVVNAVPAPFSAILLVPAAALLRLRRRYRRP